MSKNVGGAEQAIRLIVGVALLALAFFHVVSGTMAMAAYALGAIALVTGLIRFCPLWTVFGVNTCATAPKGTKSSAA